MPKKCCVYQELEDLVKLSDLNEISIPSKPIERQRVSICLSFLTHAHLGIIE